MADETFYENYERRLRALEERQQMTEATVAELQEAVTTLTTAFNAFATDVNQTIADLEAKAAGGEVINASDLGPIKDSLATLTTSVDAADATVKGEDPGPEPEPVATPDKPVYIDEQAATSTEGWTPSGFEVPAVPAVPADPTTGAAEVPEVPAVPLWYFDADAVGGEPTGAVENVWTVYTGPTEPVPAPTQ
jgi:uncharacterized coiled-coil protein SlyX